MKLWSAEDLANHLFRETYLVEPIIPKGGVVLFHGKRGIGKTQFMLTLTSCLAEGGRFFGRYRTKANAVVAYIQADTPIIVQQERVVKARQLYRLQQLYFTFPKLLNIMDQEPTYAFVTEIQRLHPDLVVWDTLNKIHHMDPNAPITPPIVYGKAQTLFPDAAHVFVHHDKKTIAEQDKLDDDEFFSGSGGWLDAADTGLHLVQLAPGRLHLTFTKTRTCAPQPPVALTFHPESLLLYASEDISTLANDWRRRYPSGTETQLRGYLLASFVASPRAIDHYLHPEPLCPPDTKPTSSSASTPTDRSTSSSASPS